MATYRCNDCGNPIFTGDNLAGALRLTCPNRQCPSRRQSPPRQQKYDFSGGQKAMRGVARRSSR